MTATTYNYHVFIKSHSKAERGWKVLLLGHMSLFIGEINLAEAPSMLYVFFSKSVNGITIFGLSQHSSSLSLREGPISLSTLQPTPEQNVCFLRKKGKNEY